MLTPRTIASQMRMADLVLTIQKNGKANTSENAAPARYSGRRPTRSDRAPYTGMATSPIRAAMTTPQSMVLLASSRCSLPYTSTQTVRM